MTGRPAWFVSTALALLVLVTAPTGARASTYPGERPTTDPLMSQTVDIGLRFWRTRGVEPCPTPIVLVARTLLDVDGVDAVARAELDGCRIWIARYLMRAARRERAARPRWGDDSAREELCRVVVHELGHTAGLEHDDGDVMAERATPFDCRVWRRGLDRRERRQGRLGTPRR